MILATYNMYMSITLVHKTSHIKWEKGGSVLEQNMSTMCMQMDTQFCLNASAV